MKITTWNINGMRAAIRKGLERELERIDPDVLLLQEVRAQPEQLPDQWADPEGWHALWHPAQKPGYSGVAILSRHPIKRVSVGMGPKLMARLNGRAPHHWNAQHPDPNHPDPEGRLLLAKVGALRLASVYLPSGSSSEARQAEKDKWLPLFNEWANPKLRSRIPTLLAGDFNIAHTERDIFHWRSNQKTSGFLPHERKWIGEFFDAGWRDFVREQWGDEVDGPYTWWSNRGRARELDRGWRIDYILGNRAAARLVKNVTIDREAGLAISDHAPVSVEFDV